MTDETANFISDRERVNEDVCWYDFLDQQHKYTVYSIPGGGWINFMTILSTIDLSNFNECIIQETFEPRVYFHRNDKFRINKRKNYEIHYGDVRPHIDKLKYHYAWMHPLMVQASVTQCNHILQNANIPAVSFSFQGGQFEHTWIKKLDVPPIVDTLMFKKKYHNFSDEWEGHLTQQGNVKLGKLIRSVL